MLNELQIKIVELMKKNYNLNKKDIKILKFRYDFCKSFTRNLILHLGIQKYTEINLVENLYYKIAGYNINLDSFTRNLILIKLMQFLRIKYLFKLSLLKKKIYKIFALGDFKEYEIQFYHVRPRMIDAHRYKNIYFASMNNYLTSLIPHIIKSEDSLLIIPLESKKWLNYQKVLENNINHVFIEEVINYDDKAYLEIKSNVMKKYQENREKILHYNYDFSFLDHFISKFITEYLPLHLTLINSLKLLVEKISDTNTNFYIARDRRGLENAFIQISNVISNNSNMLIHGMISFDFNKRLWVEGRFKNCKTVSVWGHHAKNVIEYRQKLLNESCPIILIQGNPSLKKFNPKNNQTILFICQSFTNKYIPLFSRKLKDHLIIARLHPGDRDQILKYKKFEKENLIVDDLNKDLHDLIENSNLVVSYSSTGVLESLYNNIPTLFIYFRNLRKKYPLIFDEVQVKVPEFEKILLNKRNFTYKINRVFNDNNYKQEIIRLNNKIFKYFISSNLT